MSESAPENTAIERGTADSTEGGGAGEETAAAAVQTFSEEEFPTDGPRIELDRFSGPFEVLLYLIKSQEIDIFDIPILKVTEQYLRFIDMMREQNLEVAGDFLVMAATLIQIKSRMILPIETEEEEEEEFEEEDPRLDLVEKLLEYRKFRDLAALLGDRSEVAKDCFARSAKPKIEAAADDGEVDLEVGLYDLTKAIRGILRFITEKTAHEIIGEGASIEDKITRIEALLESRGTVDWRELYKECASRVELVCCLLAILELCRMGRIRAHQHHMYGNIRIFALNTGEEVLPPPELKESDPPAPVQTASGHVSNADNNVDEDGEEEWEDEGDDDEDDEDDGEDNEGGNGGEDEPAERVASMSGAKRPGSAAGNPDMAQHRGWFVALSAALAQRIRRLFESGLLPILGPRHGRALGPWGESVAARHLRRQGFKILDRNVRLGRNEIDIIARDQDTIVFVEVRTRGCLDDTPPEDSITETKMRHLRKAARHYISRHGAEDTYYRFDTVSVVRSQSGRPELSHFRDAFQ